MSGPRNTYGSGMGPEFGYGGYGANGGYGNSGGGGLNGNIMSNVYGNYGGSRFPNMGVGNNSRIGTQFRPGQQTTPDIWGGVGPTLQGILQGSNPFARPGTTQGANPFSRQGFSNGGYQPGQGTDLTQVAQSASGPLMSPSSPGSGVALTNLFDRVGGGTASPYPNGPAPTSDPNNPLSFDYWARRRYPGQF